MSSYLSVYIVPKRKNEQETKNHILILCYSRNSEIYQYVYENLNPAYAGNDGEQYSKLTQEDINLVLKDIKSDIVKTKERLELYEKYASVNADYIEDIMSQKEYLSDLTYCESQLTVIEDIIDNAELYKEIEEVCCNID